MINELTNAIAYREEQRRRLSEYRDAQRQVVIQRTERITAEQREREQQAQQERDERQRQRIENRLKIAFLAAAGTEGEWEANHERLVLEELERDTVQRANRAKAQVRGELGRALI